MLLGYENMMMSDESWSSKLRRIGDYERGDHSHLSIEDICVYFGEYTPTGESGKPAWSLSKANNRVSNLKKPPSTKGTTQWAHKINTIKSLGGLIRRNLEGNDLQSLTFVPAPPSKTKDDSDYDSRMLQVAKAIGNDMDARPILETVLSRIPASLSENSRSVDGIKANTRIDESEVELRPVSKTIIFIDDMITTGATFVACKSLLIERFGNVQVYGLFIVRRVPLDSSEDFEDFDIDLT